MPLLEGERVAALEREDAEQPVLDEERQRELALRVGQARAAGSRGERRRRRPPPRLVPRMARAVAQQRRPFPRGAAALRFAATVPISPCAHAHLGADAALAVAVARDRHERPALLVGRSTIECRKPKTSSSGLEDVDRSDSRSTRPVDARTRRGRARASRSSARPATRLARPRGASAFEETLDLLERQHLADVGRAGA